MEIFFTILEAIGSGFGIILILLFKFFKFLLPFFVAMAIIKIAIWLLKTGFKKIYKIIKDFRNNN